MATPKKKTTKPEPETISPEAAAKTTAASKTSAPSKSQSAQAQMKNNTVNEEKKVNSSAAATLMADGEAIVEVSAFEALAQNLKKDAEWMAFVDEQKTKLLDLKDQILDNVSGVARDTLRNHPEGSEASGSGEHTGDAGSDAYDREFALSLLSQGQDSLYEIEDALERIKRGVYGICEICLKQIPQVRLEAIPFARLTVDCKTLWEKEHGTKSRFRPKRSGFGYSEGQIDLESSPILLDEDEE